MQRVTLATSRLALRTRPSSVGFAERSVRGRVEFIARPPGETLLSHVGGTLPLDALVI